MYPPRFDERIPRTKQNGPGAAGLAAGCAGAAAGAAGATGAAWNRWSRPESLEQARGLHWLDDYLGPGAGQAAPPAPRVADSVPNELIVRLLSRFKSRRLRNDFILPRCLVLRRRVLFSTAIAASFSLNLTHDTLK